MVLVFALCTVIILITLFMFIITLSTIKFEIKDFETTNLSIKDKNSLSKYKFIISIYFLNKIKYLSITINKNKVQKIYRKLKLDNMKFDFKQVRQEFKLRDLNYIKILNIKLSYLDSSVKIGVEDTLFTTYIVFFLSTIISILLPHVIQMYEPSKYYYEVLPLYVNRNAYEIKLNCIIEIKMVHIINVIYIFLKKRRVDNNEQRTSNRRSYGYSYE